MPRQVNIVSFDAARRAASDTRASGRERAARGRILIGGDQSAIVKDRPASGASCLGASAIPAPRRNKGSARSGSGIASGSRYADRLSDAPRRSANPTPSWYNGSVADDRRDEVFARPASARAARFSDDEVADDYDERLEEALERRSHGVFGRMRSRSAERRRERTKERADRAYFRQYEAGKGADGASGGPRAAVYKGEMGASHKRSSRMQQAASDSGGRSRTRRMSAEKGPFFTRAPFMGFAAAAFCLVFAVAFLYGPAQQLYMDIRERDRLTAEYEAVVQRNEAIGQQVSALQTDAGVEDVARTQLGWVREGEHAVSVSGLDPQKESDFRGNIVSEDIELPDTWYSGVLDPLFGVK